MKASLLLSLLVCFANTLQSQCTVTLTYTPASCSTCCDGCISASVTSPCPPFAYSWFPADPNEPVLCMACADTSYILTVYDNCGCTAIDTVSTEWTTGVVSINQENDVVIYPNPTSSIVTISSTEHNIIHYTVFNALSKQTQNHSCNSRQVIFNASEFSNGYYILQIELSNGQVLRRNLMKV